MNERKIKRAFAEYGSAGKTRESHFSVVSGGKPAVPDSDRRRFQLLDTPEKPLFRDVYDEYYPRVRNYISSKIANRATAEDLAQEAMVSAYRSYDSFDPARSSLATWVFVIARNRLKNYYRDRRETESIDDKEGFDLPSQETLQEEVLEFEEMRVVVRRLLDSMEARDRTIVERRFFHDKSAAQIAKELGLTEGNVRVRQKRILDRLRPQLVELGYS